MFALISNQGAWGSIPFHLATCRGSLAGSSSKASPTATALSSRCRRTKQRRDIGRRSIIPASRFMGIPTHALTPYSVDAAIVCLALPVNQDGINSQGIQAEHACSRPLVAHMYLANTVQSAYTHHDCTASALLLRIRTLLLIIRHARAEASNTNSASTMPLCRTNRPACNHLFDKGSIVYDHTNHQP
jgi:hypothetical protein